MGNRPQNKREIKSKNNVNKNISNKSNKKKKKKSGKLSKVLILLVIILIALAGGIIYKIKFKDGGMQDLLITLVGHNEETLKSLEPIQVLLMGMSTDNGAKLTDTIIIGTYNPQDQSTSLLSIPRDTFVGKNPTTGNGYDKINSIYQKKGAEGTLEKVNELTGLDIKYYMVIDNQALIELVDVIGGVEFNVPINMNYDDKTQNLHIHLKAGLQTLDGDKAEQLLRFRKNNDLTTYPEEYGGNDYGRMRTQREFMIETAKQTLKAKNILKIKDIIDIAYEYVETNLSISTIKDYVPYAIDVNIDEIQSEVLPGASYGPPTYPLWFFIPDKKESAELIDRLYGNNDELTEADDTENNVTNEDNNTTSTGNIDNTTEVDKKEASEIKIELINGSGASSALTKIKKQLVNKGYKVTRTTTTTSTTKTTIINKTDVDTKFTDNIKELLEVGNVSSSSVSSSNVDITIIIGKDYNK